jgi:hypothetical protein
MNSTDLSAVVVPDGNSRRKDRELLVFLRNLFARGTGRCYATCLLDGHIRFADVRRDRKVLVSAVVEPFNS